MVTVFKPRRYKKDPATGSKIPVKYRVWYVRFKSPTGDVVTKKGYPDKDSTRALGVRLQKEAIRQREGIVEKKSPSAGRPLLEWLDEFLPVLQARKASCAEYATETGRHIRQVLSGCRFKKWGDLDAERVTRFLVDLWKQKGVVSVNVQSLQHVYRNVHPLVADEARDARPAV